MLKITIFSVFLLIILMNNVYINAKQDMGKFRMEKINFIWSKALTQLSKDTDRLEKLQRDLTIFDELYLNLKQDGTHFKSNSDSVEEIDRKLETLLERYDLEDTILAFRLKYKYNHKKIYATLNEEKSKQKLTEKVFTDERIAKLWDEAKNEKTLSLKQLDDLFNDLSEHEEKLIEYNSFLKQISKAEKSSNKIEKDNKDNAEIISMAKKMNLKLENNFENLQQRFQNLKNNPFKNPKARELWEKAVQSPGLIPNELDGIRSELRYFERQIEKLDYHHEQISEAEELGKTASKGNIHEEQTNEARQLYEKMYRKIKKLSHYLDEKFSGATSKVHGEL